MVFNLINFCHILQQIHPSTSYKCNRLKNNLHACANSLLYIFLIISYLSPLFFFITIIYHHFAPLNFFSILPKKGEETFNDPYGHIFPSPSLLYSGVLDEHHYLYTFFFLFTFTNFIFTPIQNNPI